MVDYERLRKAMVDNQLRTSNITDRRVLGAMLSVPRERFVPEARVPFAYVDEAQPLGHGRQLPAPAPFARLVQLIGPAPGERVLDVGAAMGYSSAVLAQLGTSVTALETEPALADAAARTLSELGFDGVSVRKGGIEALAKGETFDVIVLEGSVDAVPQALIDALADGGRLVAVIRRGPAATAHLFVRSGSAVNSRPAFDAALPPLSTVSRDEFVF